MASANPFQNLTVSFAPGERIFSEGEVGATMFIVQSGRVRIFHGSGGQSVDVAEMEKGDFFGEMSLLEGTARTISADALENTELIEINSTTFDRMIRGNIEIAVRLLRKLSSRLQKTENLLATRLAVPAPAAAAIPVHAEAVRRPAAPLADPPSPMAPARIPAHAPAAAPAAPRPVPAPSVPNAFASNASASPASSRAAAFPAVLGTVPRGTAVLALSVPEGPGTGPRLVAETGDTVFAIVSSDATVGRYDPVTETQPEVDLTLLDIKRSVSRQHAKITLRNGGYLLTEEVGALNGTFVNGAKLVTGKPAPIKNGDKISLGTVHLVFRT